MVEIEPDFIKLDMSLTRHLETSLVKQKLIGTLRDFCRQAGIALVAEGIETQAQLDALLDLGIAYGQGFLFAHPGSPYPLRETIRAGRCACGDRRPRRRARRRVSRRRHDPRRAAHLRRRVPLVVESRPR